METALPIKARVHVLIPAAGRGVRFGSAENKLFALLAGRPVIARTVSRFIDGGIAESVTVIGRSDELDRLEQACGAGNAAVSFCAGGETRQESVQRGLEVMDAQPDDVVLVHDGARPLVPHSVIAGCIEAVLDHGCAVAALPINETVKREGNSGMIAETRERAGLWTAQTPQGARFGLMTEAFALAKRDDFIGTDEASLLERLPHVKPKLVMGARQNVKITTQEDLLFAEQWLRSEQENRMELRVGNGYDIHRLVPGRKLILGGVEIESEVGLLGHSDADVLLHALCDALLGAAGMPDIGHLFPNTDPAYAGANSVDLLKDVAGRLYASGYVVGNVDVSIIAERPKIAPYSERMRAVIAGVLGVRPDAVSIKATTNEGIGALGAGEGIACHATATIHSSGNQ